MRLASALSARLPSGSSESDFHESCYTLIDELRSNGHELWSFDESDDFQIWGPDYTKPGRIGIVVTFQMDGGVEVSWSKPGRAGAV